MITLPKSVDLRAMKQSWRISRVVTPGKLLMMEYQGKELVLYGKKYTKRSALKLIRRWVRLKAHHFLSDKVDELKHTVGVDYKRLIIRSQEMQWGSYSSTRTISLNYKLIFLPPVLVKHVILHELCHVDYLSHCPKFWAHLNHFDRRMNSHRAALAEADKYIPKWINF